MGLNESDIRRVIWTFVMAAGAWALAAWTNLVPGQPIDLKAIGLGLLAAGFSAVKNLLLDDGSSLK